MNLSDFSNDLITLISSNTMISTLILSDYWTVDLEFLKSVLKIKTLLYLILSEITINEACASILAESNLKGINVEHAKICQEEEKMIYSKIPKIQFYRDFKEYEEYLN